jgi:hypothetical protein
MISFYFDSLYLQTSPPNRASRLTISPSNATMDLVALEKGYDGTRLSIIKGKEPREVAE